MIDKLLIQLPGKVNLEHPLYLIFSDNILQNLRDFIPLTK